MELHYIYIDDYRSIKKQNINLISEYIFEFVCGEIDKNDSLNYKKNNDYVDNFFNIGDDDKLSNVISVSSLVGENGAGKSSVLQIIIDLIGSPCQKGNDFILVTRENGKFNCYTSLKWKDKLNIDKNFFEGLYTQHDNKITEFLKDMIKSKYCSVLVSNIVDTNNFDNYNDYIISGNKFISYTTGNLISNAKTENELQDDTVKKDLFLLYNSWQNNRNLEFLLNKNLKESIPFEIPEYCYLSYKDISHFKHNPLNARTIDMSDFNPNLTIWFPSEDDLKTKYKFDESLGFDQFDQFYSKFYFLQNLIENFLKEVNLGSLKELEIYVENYIDTKSESYLFENIDEMRNYYYSFFDNINKKCKSVSNYTEIHKLILNIKNLIKYICKLNIFDIVEPNISIKFHIKEFEKFYSLYTKTVLEFDYIAMEFDALSSGQVALLNLFSRLLYFKKKLHESYDFEILDNIIILFDEGELYMHPEWQRTFLYNIITLCRKLFSDTSRNLQIISSTNSPFSLSDLPLYNVTFLKTRNHIDVVTKQTFGINISDLLINNFFMKDIIGEFARKKIDQLVNRLLQLKKEKNVANFAENYSYEKINLEKQIEMIEEVIVKTYLKKLFNDVFNTEKSELFIDEIDDECELKKIILQAKSKLDNLNKKRGETLD